jgi:hypothetical protein
MSDSVDLIVPNVAEFNLRNPALNLGPAVESSFTRIGMNLCDQSVFWSAGNRVLVLPGGYDPWWLDDVHRALGSQPPPVVCPAKRTGLLVQDLLRDAGGLGALRELLTGHKVVRLLSWGATAELYPLVAAVRGWGLEVEHDGVTEDSYWTSLYLDSKMSCLDLARHVPEVRVPRGITVTSWAELRGALDVMLAAHPQVIVRSMHGVGGEGSAVVRSGGRGVTSFWNTVHREAFFRSFPLSVQEYVEHAPEDDCPAVDMRVDDGGAAEMMVSAMTVDGHRFRSVNVGLGAVPPAEADRIVRVGRRIGMAARDLGFRGWLCVDYLVGAGGELYVTEINARRSGAMAAISLLRLWGAESDLTVFSHDTFGVGLPPPVSYRQHVRPVFERLWADGVRAYPANVRGLGLSRPTMGLVTAAATAAEAEHIAAAIGRSLNPADH